MTETTTYYSETLRAEPGETTSDRTLLTVEAEAERLSLGRTTLYGLLRDGRIPSVRIGRLRRIPVEALAVYTARLLAEQDVT